MKERLEELKEKNKKIISETKIKNNILLNECIEALGNYGNILCDKDSKYVYHIFEKIPFLPWGVDWQKFQNSISLNKIEEIPEVCEKEEFYIIWSNELPIINSSLYKILDCIEDICAVEADTWLLSNDFNELIEFHHEGKITFGRVIV